MRVHELAKKLGIESKEALAALNDLGVDVKSVHAAVSEEDAARVGKSIGAPARLRGKSAVNASARSWEAKNDTPHAPSR